MRIQGVVEIGRAPLGDNATRLLSFAYRISRSAVVMVVLDRIARIEADRYLDGVVEREGNDVKGVVYADLADERLVAEVALNATFVVASTDEFRCRLAAHGIACEDALTWPERADRDVRLL